MIEVMMVGSPVYFSGRSDTLKGTVTAICIREHNYIKYEVSYWLGDQHYVDWFEQAELQRTDVTASTKIGFIT